MELQERRAQGIMTPREEQVLTRLLGRKKERLDVLRQMMDYGMQARIVPGTDSGVASLAFGHLDYELRLLVEAGFTPAEALIAATRTTAEAIGMAHEIGTIEVGKTADLVAFDGDPITDISAVSRVAAVFLGGNRIA